jgi:serine/threonine protein kinase
VNELDLFAAAVAAADPAERAALLDRECAGDPVKRARLEALLRAHDRPDSLLDRPAVAPHEPDTATTHTIGHEGGGAADGEVPLGFLAPATRPDSLGRIGHYEILQVLGHGGFGIVFLAFDEVLHRVVAVKVLSPQMAATSPARKRFLREARASAQVRHEHVVQVYEVGEAPLPYIAMEFIPGETLQQRLDRVGPVEPSEVVRVGRQIAEGLAAAHANDLIHRDIKPGNVLLEGGAGRVKITDFGLARAADDASISRSGIIAGTPMYMAPEQAKGDKLDQRADLFSLGSVLYQMAAGRPPFRANSTVAVLKRVAEDAPRDIHEVIPETPQWLCDIIAKLHEKNPDDRYQSAREVADVLADCEAQLKENAKLKDFSRIPRSKPRRSGRWKWVTAAVLVIIGVSLTWWRGWVQELFGDRPPNATGTTSTPAVSRKVAWGDVVDPLGDCRFVEDGRRLTIEVPGGPKQHDFNPQPGRNDRNAPRVLREVEGDFEAHVTVSDPVVGGPMISRSGRPYVAAGLLLWQDENHFLRICRSRTDVPPDPTYTDVEWLWGAGEVQHLTWSSDSELKHLRLRRLNDVLFVAVSKNGQDWTDVASKSTGFTCTGPVRVGVVAISNVFQDSAPEFAGFKIKGLPPGPPLPNARPFFIAPLTAAEVQRISALPAAEQVAEVRKELIRRNPDFDGKLEHKIEDGVVAELRMNVQQVTDISPIRAFDALRMLACTGEGTAAPLEDLSPLQGMNLTGLTQLNLNFTHVNDAGLAYFKDCKRLMVLDLSGTQVTDAGLTYFKGRKNLTSLRLQQTQVTDAGLAHFKDCKNLMSLDLNWMQEVTDAGLDQFKDCKNLTLLHVGATRVSDAGLAQFKDCNSLTSLDLGVTQVTDMGLAYFKNCRSLKHLSLVGTKVSDVGLAHFKDCKNLMSLRIDGTATTDLSLLKGMPLKELGCDFRPERDAEILRSIKTLEKINGMPAAMFWERYGKGEFAK